MKWKWIQNEKMNMNWYLKFGKEFYNENEFKFIWNLKNEKIIPKKIENLISIEIDLKRENRKILEQIWRLEILLKFQIWDGILQWQWKIQIQLKIK